MCVCLVNGAITEVTHRSTSYCQCGQSRVVSDVGVHRGWSAVCHGVGGEQDCRAGKPLQSAAVEPTPADHTPPACTSWSCCPLTGC